MTEAAIAGILVLFNKFILIGDQKQLPAVVTQDPELCRIEGKYMEQLGLTDLRISLFERMLTNAKKKGWSQACGQLQNHYRMHADIAALIASHYEAPLITGTSIQETQAPLYALPQDHWLAPVAAHRTVFIQSPADQGIKKNQAEATMVGKIVEVLLAKGPFLPSDIGVIAPFRAQVAAIKKCLPPNLAADVNFVVDTVERYQGDERKIIIFSTAICRPSEINTIQSIWEDEVSTTDRKLLVSISRAKSQLIVLGVPEALNSSAAYRQLLQQIAGKGANFSWQELCRHR